MSPFIINFILSMEPDSQSALALLIVGGRKHGKTSFCRMLASNSEKNKIVFNQLSQCSIYRCIQLQDIYDKKKVFIVDTPAFDGKKNLFQVANRIKEFVKNENLLIIGIALVLDIKKGCQGQDLFKFLDILREEYSVKRNLFFNILSFYDLYPTNPDDLADAYKKIQIQFQAAEYQNMWNRKVQWVNRKGLLENTEEMQQKYNQQIQYLKELLKQMHKKDKKALIVMGKMGHGKSAFCRMVVSEKQKHKINAQASIKSVTTICSVFKSNKFRDIYDDDIYIIDSPGLDSREATYMIVEQLDSLIFQQGLSIVGIAYVCDIGVQRELNQKDSNHIFTFFQTLRIKYSYKKELCFVIFSKWDKHFEEEQRNQKLFNQMQKQFVQIRLSDIWHRKIQWISQPSNDLQKFHRKINRQEKLNQIYKTELQTLKSFLYFFKKNSFTLPYNIFQSDRKQFQQFLTQRMMEEYCLFQFKRQVFDLQLSVQMLEQNFKQKNGLMVGLAAGGLGAIVTGGAVIGVDAALLATGAAVGLGAVAAAAIAFVVIGSLAALGGIGYGIYRLVRYLSKQKLHKLLTAISKIVVAKLIREKMSITVHKMKFKEEVFITHVTGRDCQGEEIKFERKEGYFLANASHPGKKADIRFTCKAPTIECFKQFIERITKEFFNKDE